MCVLGITGLAQVKGRNGISVNKKIEFDLEYVNKFGLRMDLYVIRESIKVVLKETNAEITEKGITEEIEELKSNPKNKKKIKAKIKA